jgi:hypothetical protein
MREKIASSAEIAEARQAVSDGQWCDLIVLAQGRHFVIRLNGVTMVDTWDMHPTKFVARGALGIEYTHRQGVVDFVEFRDIRYKRLSGETNAQPTSR